MSVGASNMGIISSKLAPVAIRLAWFCQKLLDPRYSVECKKSKECKEGVDVRAAVEVAPTSVPEPEAFEASPTIPISKMLDNNNSLHQENRNRRATQLRFRTRPSSFDAALIVCGKAKSSLMVTSTPSSLQRQNMRMWDVTSSSGCSSDSGSNSDLDSETELRVSGNVSNEESSTKLGMTAEEEEDFRLTLGRGYFSRSKKDRFLNHLRLEKRLNDLSNEYFGVVRNSHRRNLQRRHSGDLHRII
ncbi:PREDICTED: uncharacterized protein LOC105365696 isoform X2 [Ceratosolen solmsi marchali]|uniref:Uncharacterized protein LOC105365696 isoform X2 n=1 Tax=Ceratosolen solmsi marchali TaxID=326594 RepID=A0AAJ6YQ87_9HYME|nr:PREDICTED: uncharacterized protein LOC105365696 isoform X2 [Ceratosolen solmsi marchali]